ncbi:MAG: hypothetical protein J0I49_35260 [Pseudonocardia sp.]|jgi:hypothetical protein|uniref:hypothetical protein n=1 Tax=Pseudonocardia sp. TaxID=60912 RepID=UPI001AC2B982|nr:hypothetical protein [Pseudonocardia sp.]MBN9103315.1 hypothetical protein [Pseudonocardia sp.]
MTVLDHSPRPTTYAFRSQRRHEIVTTGGMDGVLRVGAALRASGYPVRDFTVEVRDGVPYSSVSCTVSLTSAESDSFAARMGALDEVVAVDPR